MTRTLLLSILNLSILAACTAGCGDDASPLGGGGAGAGGTGGADGGGGAGGSGGSGGSEGGAGGGGGAPLEPALNIVELGLPIDLTPSGDAALLQDLASIEGDVYVLDTSGGDPVLLTSVGDATRDLATGIAATGAITALHGVPVQAGVYTETEGWLDLQNPFPTGCDQDEGGAWDISADGSVVVGLMWNGCAPQAFRWADDGGDGDLLLLELLGSGPTTATNRASVVSDDGSVVAGFASLMNVDRTPAMWTADGQGTLLDPSNVDEPGEVLSISGDGSVLAGIWGNEAFVWTEATGRVNLPRPDTLLPSDPCFANAVAANGELIFGGCGNPFFTTPVAVVWTDAGVQPLVDVVTENGLEVPDGLVLTTVLAASSDGSVALGVALDPNTLAQKSFVLTLPPSAFSR